MRELIKQLVNEMEKMEEMAQHIYILESKQDDIRILSIHKTMSGAFRSLFEGEIEDLGVCKLNVWYGSYDRYEIRRVVKREIKE